MQNTITIRTLDHIDCHLIQSEIVAGYESTEKYSVHKTESDTHIVITAALANLDVPHRNTFAEDFSEIDCQRYQGFLLRTPSYGAFDGERLIAISINERIEWNNTLRIWEFHVHPAYQRRGIGRLLMEYVCEQARIAGLRLVWLETQNTNVRAIRFYRSLGFNVEAVDLSFYSNEDVERGEVAFFMKRRLPPLPAG